jgi:DHA1 family bicyclomycin/chloramphenicol resistance-like MFS transporter
MREVLTNRRSLGYTVTAGLISGSFLGYLSSSQQIFQIQYGLGARFPLIFATLAVALGGASFLNGRLVMRYGMVMLSKWSSRILAGISTLFLLIAWMQGGHPPLWALIGYMMPALFCVGILFGNLNALAMEPLGHIAGVGAAVVGSLSLLIGVVFSSVIGQSYNGTVLPLIAGFAILSTAGVLVMTWVQQSTPIPDGVSQRK